jgi:hypothetical protein
MGGVDGLAVADHDSLRGRVDGGKNYHNQMPCGRRLRCPCATPDSRVGACCRGPSVALGRRAAVAGAELVMEQRKGGLGTAGRRHMQCMPEACRGGVPERLVRATGMAATVQVEAAAGIGRGSGAQSTD